MGDCAFESFVPDSPAARAARAVTVASPDGALVVSIAGTGAPSAATWRYRLERQDATPATELLGWSPLGLTRQDAAFTTLHLVSASTPRPLTVSYTMPFGKRRSVARTATSRVLHFQSPSDNRSISRCASSTTASRFARVSKHVRDAAHGHQRSDGLQFRTARAGGSCRSRRPEATRLRRHVLGSRRRHGRATSGRVVVSGALPHAGQRALDPDHGSRLDPSYCGTRLAAAVESGTYRVSFLTRMKASAPDRWSPCRRCRGVPWRVVVAGGSLKASSSRRSSPT